MSEAKNVDTQKEYEQILLVIKKQEQSIKNRVLTGFTEDKKIYTSWTPNGEGKEEIRWLKIISVLLLSDDL